MKKKKGGGYICFCFFIRLPFKCVYQVYRTSNPMQQQAFICNALDEVLGCLK